MSEIISALLFWVPVCGVLLVFGYSPFILALPRLFRGGIPSRQHAKPPGLSVSVIVVAHNAENLIEAKIKNCLALKYPSPEHEVVVFLDGCTDGTREKMEPYLGKGIKLILSNGHEGKYAGMNKAVDEASGDLLVFSDVDAIIEPDAILLLAGNFADEDVGGVCGQRVIGEEGAHMAEAQRQYVSADSLLKTVQSRHGSITSNDGKIYAIRRELYTPVPSGVADDLFVALNVVRKRKRFVFEPGAKAVVRVPSRWARHEVVRRRRIVSSSLRAIYLSRAVLNPFRYDGFSIELVVNKILRRLVPFMMAFIFLGSFFYCAEGLFYKFVFWAQVAFYATAVVYRLVPRRLIRAPWIVRKVSATIFYFCVGNLGSFFGVLDFLLGRYPVKWKPEKG